MKILHGCLVINFTLMKELLEQKLCQGCGMSAVLLWLIVGE